jgi:hypothetical protein
MTLGGITGGGAAGSGAAGAGVAGAGVVGAGSGAAGVGFVGPTGGGACPRAVAGASTQTQSKQHRARRRFIGRPRDRPATGNSLPSTDAVYRYQGSLGLVKAGRAATHSSVNVR